MKNYLSSRIKSLTVCLLIVIISSVCFSYTVKLRSPWFGVLSGHVHQWLTASTIKFTNIWVEEGPLSVHFGMIENPASIEFPSLLSREVYPSYPPGAIVPVYLLSKLSGQIPSPSLVMGYGLFNQFVITLLLSFFVFFFLKKLGIGILSSFLFSLVPIVTESFLPAPLYWHQSVYFADQAVILPFVVFIILEMFRGDMTGQRGRKLSYGFQVLVIFWGILTDWLFVFILGVVYLKRILTKEISFPFSNFFKQTVLFWFPAFLGVSLFLIQLLNLGVVQQLVDKFLFRTGLGAGGEKSAINFNQGFWHEHVPQGFGSGARYIFMGTFCVTVLLLVFVGLNKCFKKKISSKVTQIVSLSAVILFSCFSQIYFFRAHSSAHGFSTLKLTIVFGLLPFVLLPLALIFLFIPDIKRQFREKIICFTAIISLVLCGMHVKEAHPQYKQMFPAPSQAYKILGRFVAENTGYSDIVFSPDIRIPDNPPEMLSYSMKRVYLVSSIYDICEKVKNVNGDYSIAILTMKDIEDPGIQHLASYADHIERFDALTLYKINLKMLRTNIF